MNPQPIGPATWGDIAKYLPLGVEPASFRGSHFISEGPPVSPGAAIEMVAGKFARFFPCVRLEKTNLIEICLVGPDALGKLEALAQQLGCEIPTSHGFSVNGDEAIVRLAFDCPQYERQAIDAELRNAMRNTFEPVSLPRSFGTLTVRTKGLAALPKGDIPPASPELLTYLKSYRQVLQALNIAAATAEQAARQKAMTTPDHARKMKYAMRLAFQNNPSLDLAAGAIITEQQLIRAIEEADPNALVAIDGKVGLPALKPGEIRFRQPFFQRVDELGENLMISVAKDAVLIGDEQYADALRRAGADIETHAETHAPARRKAVTA